MSELNIRRNGETGSVSHSIFLFGMPKVGKTTEACKFPNPLVVECEPRGAQYVANVDVLLMRDLAELERSIDAILRQPHKTIVLDGITWMLEQATKSAGNKDPRQAYKMVGDRFQMLLGKILGSDKTVIATGHSRKSDDPDKAGKVEIRPDMNPDLSDSVFGAFSIVCYCFPAANGSKMLTKPDDNDTRRIMAGDRSGKLPRLMDLSADKMMEVLGMKPVRTAEATSGK